MTQAPPPEPAPPAAVPFPPDPAGHPPPPPPPHLFPADPQAPRADRRKAVSDDAT